METNLAWQLQEQALSLPFNDSAGQATVLGQRSP
jgi:hypothetical protein